MEQKDSRRKPVPRMLSIYLSLAQAPELPKGVVGVYKTERKLRKPVPVEAYEIAGLH